MNHCMFLLIHVSILGDQFQAVNLFHQQFKYIDYPFTRQKNVLISLKHIHQPIHVQAHTKVNTWNNNIIRKEKNLPVQKAQLVHVEAKSTIQTWTTDQPKSSIRRQRSASVNRVLHIDRQAKVDTWQTLKRHRSLSPIDAQKKPQQQQPIFVEPKSTIDTWRLSVNKIQYFILI